MTADVRGSLSALSARYAAGVDRRDADLLLSAFHVDATINVFPQPGSTATPSQMRGHDEIRRVVEMIASYPKTFHFVGQCLFDLGDDIAHGEVYCVAHHYISDGAHARNKVLYIRYDDEYRPDAGDEWRIVSRGVHVDWSEMRDVR
jgi:hypothetical protein